MYSCSEGSQSFGTEEGTVCISQVLGLEVHRNGTEHFRIEEWEAQFDLVPSGEARMTFGGKWYDAVLCFGQRDWQEFERWWSNNANSAPGMLVLARQKC